MKHLEILCYAIAHIDSKRDELIEKKRLFEGNADLQGMVDVMLAELDGKKDNLKTLYKIECGSEYAE